MQIDIENQSDFDHRPQDHNLRILGNIQVPPDAHGAHGMLADFSKMFEGCHIQSELNGWDVSNVDSLWSTFSGATINSELNGWNVGNVINAPFAFANAKKFLI